jgi:hypothetical protein
MKLTYNNNLSLIRPLPPTFSVKPTKSLGSEIEQHNTFKERI